MTVIFSTNFGIKSLSYQCTFYILYVLYITYILHTRVLTNNFILIHKINHINQITFAFKFESLNKILIKIYYFIYKFLANTL